MPRPWGTASARSGERGSGSRSVLTAPVPAWTTLPIAAWVPTGPTGVGLSAAVAERGDRKELPMVDAGRAVSSTGQREAFRRYVDRGRDLFMSGQRRRFSSQSKTEAMQMVIKTRSPIAVRDLDIHDGVPSRRSYPSTLTVGAEVGCLLYARRPGKSECVRLCAGHGWG